MYGEIRGMILMFILVYHFLPLNTTPGGLNEVLVPIAGFMVFHMITLLEKRFESNNGIPKQCKQEDSFTVENIEEDTITHGESISVELERDAEKSWRVRTVSQAKY